MVRRSKIELSKFIRSEIFLSAIEFSVADYDLISCGVVVVVGVTVQIKNGITSSH